MVQEKPRDLLFNETVLVKCQMCNQAVALVGYEGNKRFVPHTRPISVKNRFFGASRPEPEIINRPCSGSDMPVCPEDEIKI